MLVEIYGGPHDGETLHAKPATGNRPPGEIIWRGKLFILLPTIKKGKTPKYKQK